MNLTLLSVCSSFLCLTLLTACNSNSFPTDSAPNTIESTSLPSQSALDIELTRAENRNTESAQNAIEQAKLNSISISPLLATIPLDLTVFQKVNTQVLPSLLSAAQSSLPEDSQNTLVQQDIKDLHSDIMTQMLNGINNNLELYQAQFELPQLSKPSQSIKNLNNLFIATEATEKFLTTMSQFPQLFTERSPQSMMTAIKNQQSVLINGVIKQIQLTQTQEELKIAYAILTQSLNNRQMLTPLKTLAAKVFGDKNVAYNSNEVTPSQSDPNKISMVIKESEDTYRAIHFTNNQLENEIKKDNRGLSAADFLNNSQVTLEKEL